MGKRNHDPRRSEDPSYANEVAGAALKSAIFGLPTAEKLPRIPMNDGRGLAEGSIESSQAEEEVSRSPEVTRRSHHTSGRGQSWGSSNRPIGVVG